MIRWSSCLILADNFGKSGPPGTLPDTLQVVDTLQVMVYDTVELHNRTELMLSFPPLGILKTRLHGSLRGKQGVLSTDFL